MLLVDNVDNNTFLRELLEAIYEELPAPKTGSTPEFLAGVARMAPRHVVYVSCNPTTQVRDLAVLREHGYHVERIVPVDMFPHTKHVETVALMSKVGVE